MAVIASIGLAIAGIVNLLPVTGVLGVSWLRSLYGFDVAGADLEILLRHRAVLFGIVGGLLLAAVFRSSLRAVAVAVGFVSMAGFLVVALIVGSYGPAIARVVWADVAALLALAPAALRLGRAV
jgi:hypothetical protein